MGGRLVRVARRYLLLEIADMRGTKPKGDVLIIFKPVISTEKLRPVWMIAYRVAGWRRDLRPLGNVTVSNLRRACHLISESIKYLDCIEGSTSRL